MPVPGASSRLATLSLPNTTVDSVVDDPGDATTPPSCRVQLTVTHPPAGDRVAVWVHLPAETWNGRFQGVGGGGFLGGSPEFGHQVVLERGNPVSAAEFQAALDAIVEQCDVVGDGVRDRVVGDPLGARPHLDALVGLPTPDGPQTATDVEVVRLIGEGPRRRDGGFLWHGLAPGAPFAGLHDTAVVDGELVGQPFVFDLWWIGLFLEQDPSWDWRTLTREAFEAHSDQSVEVYSAVLATDDPDLTALADRGGKALLWHGAADFGIPFQGTVDCYERVLARMGAERTDAFLRLFLAPGVGHCGGGVGPQPGGQFEELVAWVEGGRAPEELLATRTAEDGTVLQTRPLFAHPGVARWTGEGDPDDAAGFTRAEGTRLVPHRP
ncbi:tannase/feruloyl esterase family alpha/beta hydrolase [Geodermatophilus sp. SYSU D00703]